MKQNLCIFGVGGTGGYFGGKIALAAPAELNLFFIARGEHLRRIREDGLVLKSENGRQICRPTLATDKISDLPVCDMIFLAVKSYDLISAIESIRPIVAENSIILPLLNGVDIYERIRERLDTGSVYPACVFVGTHIEAPGIIARQGGDGIIKFGPDPNRRNDNHNTLIDLFKRCAIRFEYHHDPEPVIWAKYIFIAPFALISAAYQKSLGEIMNDNVLCAEVRGIMEEIADIAAARNVKLDRGIVDLSLARAAAFPPDTKTSFQRDVETPGKKNELDLFGGTILRYGRELKIPLPVTARICADHFDLT